GWKIPNPQKNRKIQGSDQVSMVSSAVRAARPHPEERACRRRSANSKARTRVSKDEDGRALMLRDASQRIWAVEAPALASRCAAPQHEGDGARVVPAKAGTHNRRRWLWVPALAALGRDDESLERSTNLRVCEISAGAISLLWGCSLQWLLQL